MSHIINYRLNQFSWAIAAVLLLPLLFTQGMFFDGLTFASIARNLNEGVGQFWSPQYTPFVHPEYFEHPPFSFAIHSVFYRLFGDQAWVDRFYAYTLYGFSILMIRRIWALLIPSAHRSWIPQLLWTLTPSVLWVHQNNLLEAPLNAAVLAVVWLLIEGTWKKNYLWSALAGVLFFLALGIKGPVALFPLMVLPLVAVLFKEFRANALISMVVMVLSSSVLFSYFYTYEPDFAKFFEGYINQQLLPSLRGLRGAESSVFLSLGELAKQLVLPVLVLIVLAWRRGRSYPLRRESILMFCIAFSATGPLPVLTPPGALLFHAFYGILDACLWYAL
jgi:4-amino-4-deoxy-L-arabinose transferase-like glycosyltransferase